MANQYTKKRDAQRREIFWNVINSGLAGSLVFLGSLSSGSFTWQGVGAGIIAAAIVAVTKFRDYWKKEEHEYTSKIFSWLG